MWGSEKVSEKNMGMRIICEKIYGGAKYFTIFRKLHTTGLKKTNICETTGPGDKNSGMEKNLCHVAKDRNVILTQLNEF